MRKPFLRITALTAAIACAPLAFAIAPPPDSAPAASGSAQPMWQRGGQMHMRHGRGGMGMFRQLDLTDAQRADIRKIREADMQQMRDGMQKLHEQRTAFMNATPGTPAYRSATDVLAKAEAAAAQARVVREADVHTKIYNVLTPAQRTKLASLRAERQAKMQQGQKSRMQRHGAPASSAPASR